MCGHFTLAVHHACKREHQRLDARIPWRLEDRLIHVPRGARSEQAMRSGGRVVEGARLESEYTAKPYRGFESLPLRHTVQRTGLLTN